ncbi:hypothetical protein [Burkholderia gladioli]|uniref:hypothetical protein n=1 Tax=Burkholderia gladioli TaxID=28095 RepID=UPI00163DF88C|nr:hypothetical protein [Burkholderia gladioli]
MDTYAINSFCERWVRKASNYESGDLEDLFDRFFTLFVPFNRFYSACAELYRAPLPPFAARRFTGDRNEATEVMARLIPQGRFDEIIADDLSVGEACECIARLLEQRRFYLHSVRESREPDYARDLELAAGLRRHSVRQVLQCLYQIRCNIFHGEKEFSPRQSELLVPANVLLAVVVELSRDAFQEIASR